MKFCIQRVPLRYALEYLAPFIKPQKKNKDEECCDEEALITLPEPYFDDKVTFRLFNDSMSIYVIVDEIKVERSAPAEICQNGPEFCLPFAYLQQEVERNVCNKYRFVEDRFFGFMVYNDETGEHLFDINAYSIRRQNKIGPMEHDWPEYRAFNLETSIFMELLRDFDKYTKPDRNFLYKRFIWCQISEGCCNIFATDGSSLRLKRYHTEVTGQYVFSIPGQYASRVLSIIPHWPTRPIMRIECDSKLCRITKEGFGDIIAFAMNLDLMPDLQNILEPMHTPHKATIQTESLRSTFRMIKAMDSTSRKLILHFMDDHVNLYWKDHNFNKSIFEFKDIDDCYTDFVVCLDVRTFERIIDEISSDTVGLYCVNDRLLHIVGEEEEVYGDLIRVMATSKMDEQDQELLEEGDEALEKDQHYLNKYYPEEEEEEEEEGEENCQRATFEEMREEAISRMKAISLYPEIIEYFKEEGEPQVYEPPQGAGYALEEDELDEVHETESDRGILIWGVIRLFTKLSGVDTTIDHYLFVSSNKDDWEDERRDLNEGTPFVYTSVKEYPLKDYGHINIYMSPGGTPLRKSL